ncbi:hypothetical protein MC885_018571, partial [Smutsia gigantea]
MGPSDPKLQHWAASLRRLQRGSAGTCADSTQWMPRQASHQERPEEPPSLCPQNTCQLCQDTSSAMDETDPQLCTVRGKDQENGDVAVMSGAQTSKSG